MSERCGALQREKPYCNFVCNAIRLLQLGYGPAHRGVASLFPVGVVHENDSGKFRCNVDLQCQGIWQF